MNSDTAPFLSPAVRLINQIDKIRQTDYRARLISWKTGFHSASYRFPQDKTAFIHIPKTGGTTIHAILESFNDDDRFINLHMHRPVSIHCPPGSYDYFTMIRHPVSRVYSYYKMAERDDRDNPYSHLCQQGIEHFLSRCWETRNMCCRYMAGTPRKEVTEETLKTACDNLLKFKFVGLFEEFESSVDQLCSWMGQTKPALPHHRRSPPVQPTPDETSAIEKYNEYDLRLYQFYLQERDTINH